MLYIIREGPFLLVAVLGNDGKLGERKPWFAFLGNSWRSDERRERQRSGRGVGTAVQGAPATLLTD